MAQYDINLAPNGAQTLDVAGTYFSYKGGLGPIRVTSSDGAVVDLLPGQGMSKLKFDRLTIKDLSGAANAGIVLAGNGEWRDERITGTVEVVDGGKNKTLAGQAFMKAGGCATAANSFGAWGLWNPAGSGKIVVVSSYTCQGGAAGIVAVRGTAIQLAGVGSGGRSKMVKGAGTAMSAAVDCAESLPATGLRANEFDLDYPFIQANTTFPRTFKEPIVIAPGYGIHMLYFAQSAQFNGTFEWTEEAA